MKPMFTASSVSTYLKKFGEEAKSKMLETMIAAGEKGVETARFKNPKNYKDHTGNLRNSVGFIVQDDGVWVHEYFKKNKNFKGGSEGIKAAKEVASVVSAKFPNGIILIMIAGMNYSLYVESLEDYDVISYGAMDAEDYLIQVFEHVKKL